MIQEQHLGEIDQSIELKLSDTLPWKVLSILESSEL